VLGLHVLIEDAALINQSELGAVETYVSCKKENVVHSVALTIWTDARSCPVANALNMGVLLNLCKVLLVLPHLEVSNDFISRNLNANSDWWTSLKVLYILGVEILEKPHVTDVERYLEGVRK
jgi:hypothetical protein